MRVLAFWPDELFRRRFEILLEAAGHEPFFATKLTEALAAVTRTRPGAVLLAPEVETREGVLVARRAESQSRGCRVLVGLSAVDPDRERTYRTLGLNEFLPAAVPAALVEALARVPEADPALTQYERSLPQEIVTLEELYSHDRTNPEGQYLLGFAYYRAEEFERARACLVRVVFAAPDMLAGAYYLASSLYRLGRLEDARRHWQSVIDRDPKASLAKKARRHLQKLDRPPSSAGSSVAPRRAIRPQDRGPATPRLRRVGSTT